MCDTRRGTCVDSGNLLESGGRGLDEGGHEAQLHAVLLLELLLSCVLVISTGEEQWTVCLWRGEGDGQSREKKVAP